MKFVFLYFLSSSSVIEYNIETRDGCKSCMEILKLKSMELYYATSWEARAFKMYIKNHLKVLAHLLCEIYYFAFTAIPLTSTSSSIGMTRHFLPSMT